MPCSTKFLQEFVFANYQHFFCPLLELIVAIVKDWCFFLSGINFCGFWEVGF